MIELRENKGITDRHEERITSSSYLVINFTYLLLPPVIKRRPYVIQIYVYNSKG